MTERNAKIIYMAGVEKCDLLYYLMKIGDNAGKKILVIDNSKCKDLYQMYQDKAVVEFITVKNITVGKNIRYFSEVHDLYDYVFIYSGMNKINEQWYEKSDQIYVVTSYEKLERDRIRHILKDTDKTNLFLVFRDKATKKISESIIESELKVKHTEHVVIPFIERDYAMYITMQENKAGSIKGVSPEMQDALKLLMMKCFDMQEKDFKKYAK